MSWPADPGGRAPPGAAFGTGSGRAPAPDDSGGIRRKWSLARDAAAGAILPSRVRRARRLSQAFVEYADEAARGGEPLYAALSTAISGDREMLGLANRARIGQPVPNLLFASVHYLLLKGAQDALREYYPNLAESPLPSEDAFQAFRAFCLAHREAVQALLRDRLVQTNEVRRSAMLVPAFEVVARTHGRTPLALVELGASAGLNLLWDRYAFDYGGGRTCGRPGSSVRIACEPRGGLFPPLPSEPLRVAFRLGVDLNPVDLRDPDAILWLQALTRPSETGRRELLEEAAALARDNPPKVVRGDAIGSLEPVLSEAPPETVLCVFHSYFANQIGEPNRRRLAEALRAFSKRRDVERISLEYGWTEKRDLLELESLCQGTGTSRVLAACDNRGAWIEWLDASSA